MDTKILQQLCNSIYRQFPDLNGEKPTVRNQGTDKQLLIFKGYATTVDGNRLPRTVRVVAAHDGSILKLTTSR